MWKMEQVCVCPAVLPLEAVSVSIHATLLEHLCNSHDSLDILTA